MGSLELEGFAQEKRSAKIVSNECWSSGSASKMIYLLWQQRGFLDLEYNSEKRWTMLRFERALCVEKRESTLSFSRGCDTAVTKFRCSE